MKKLTFKDFELFMEGLGHFEYDLKEIALEDYDYERETWSSLDFTLDGTDGDLYAHVEIVFKALHDVYMGDRDLPPYHDVEIEIVEVQKLDFCSDETDDIMVLKDSRRAQKLIEKYVTNG